MAVSKTRTQKLAELKAFQFARILAIITVLSTVVTGFGAHTVNLAWNASTDNTVVGYKVYYGADPSTLATGSFVDVGANLSTSITNLGSGTFYFGATSYNSNRVESDLSNLASTNFSDVPVIVSQSMSVTCAYGATTNLTVSATGGSLSYQWMSNNVAMANGGNVSGVTTSSLTFTSAVDANQGSYNVLVSNSAGTATSATMTLAVIDPPSIVSQPISLTRNAGAIASFSVSATGAPVLGYQWLKNGTAMVDGGNVLGSATASLTVNNVSATDAANYQCVVANSYGSATSASAALTIVVPAAITSQPVSQTLNTGVIAVFNVGATGTAPLTYSWTKNGNALVNGATVFGATTASLSISNIASADAGTYAAIVSNAGGTATSSSASLTVIAPPAITLQPSSVTTNAGSVAVLAVTAQGSQPISYQWTRLGAPVTNSATIAGASSPSLTFLNLSSSDASSYKCVVTNSAGSVTSGLATVTVLVPPTIATQPSNQVATNGATAVFTVSASGSGTLSYAWSKNGVGLVNGGNIAGAGTTALTVSAISGADVGSYSVVVSNSIGNVTSSAATLTIIIAPSITSQPSNVTTNAGGSASFNVAASGSQPMSYKWQFNGAAISGATSSSYALVNVQAANAGSYSCVVSNQAGSATSAAATLTVFTAPSFTSQPANVTTNVGGSASFSVAATGSQPMSYLWQFNGAAISGATSSSYSLVNVQTANAGSYSCVVSNQAGSVTSAVGKLTVITAPSITSQPANVSVTAGSAASFSVTASGSLPLSYKWQFNGAAISGATGSSYGINKAQTANAGSYSCVVSNQAGSVTSSAATLTIITAPSITSQPANATASVGSSTSFSVVAGGSQLFYNWQFNGAAISGATSSSYTLLNVQTANAGSYSCLVSNQAGTVTSSAATLTVVTGPAITSQPLNLTTNVGGSASFSVVASGSQPISYVWQFNGAAISGATSSSYALLNVQVANVGSYTCVVSNQAGSVTSSAGMLTVIVAPSITSQPANATANVGTSTSFSVATSGSQPMAYKWQFNGAAISGATSSSYALLNVQAANAGSYSCVVSNQAGSATSSAATLTVITAASITSQPVNVTTNAGGSASFAVTASGSQPMSYQWQFNNAAIAGATSPSYAMLNVQNANAGSYSCVVSNQAGSVTSSAAILTVITAPSISSQPANVTTNVGGSASFSVAASGSQPMSYNWQFNGAAISGATSSSYALLNVQNVNAGSYSCVVSNQAGSATSSPATLTVITAPSITSQPANVTTNVGSSASFSVAAGGSQPMSYNWQFNGAAIAGATSASYALLHVQSSNAGSYSCVVSNQAGSTTSSAATLTVITAPSITSQPLNVTTNVGGSASFDISVSGSQPMSYQWQFNSAAIAGATSPSCAILNVQNANAGSYSCVVSNQAGSVTSSAAILTVVTGPAITSQPANVTTNVGGSASFSVAVTGSQPMSYKWQFNGAAIAGATSASYALLNVQTANAGSYSCVVSNQAGSVTSSVATLTVIIAPTISSQPVNATVNAGSSTFFSVTASGSQPMSYVWQFNGAPIVGATGSIYSIASAQTANAGSYSCVVSNQAGSVTSSAATLTVITGPSITSQPANVTTNAGGSASFSVAVTGSQPMSYKWQFNGAAIAGATSASYALLNVQTANAGSYSCVVSNQAGSVTSSVASLTVITAPTIFSQPVNATANAGSSTSFSVTASGSQPMSYVWQFNGAPIAGATASIYSIASVQTANAGSYFCVVSNQAGSVTSSAATLTVITAPSITSQPLNVTTNVGSSASFNVVAGGSQPLSYQWQLNSAPISGATGSSYAMVNVQAANAGSYSCMVSNQAGSVTSSAASLTVIIPPSITSQPANATANAGSSASFSVTTSGSQPMSYKWQLNGAAISGATSSSYILANAQVANAGSYSCVVSNQAGSVTSSAAILTVITPPSIVSQPANATVSVGSTTSFTVMTSGSQPMSYNWQFNGAAISGATSSSYAMANVQNVNAGSYSCVVSNQAGSVTSSAATLTIITGPAITSQPGNATANVGSAASFSVAASGSQPIVYNWQFNGAPIAGATGPAYSIANVQTANTGSYSCVVTNSAGTVTSSAATLTVIIPPSISSQPSTQSVTSGSAAHFIISATGTAPLSYTWKKNGSPLVDGGNISGAATASLTVASTTSADAGSYLVVVTNAAGSVTSSAAALVVQLPPSITAQPLSVTTNAGAPVSFAISAQGNGFTLSYSWLKNGVQLTNGGNISGATSATLTLANVAAADAGSYQCIATTSIGTATSANATLTVIVPPDIASQPSSQTINTGASAIFSISANGTAPLSYAWFKNGTPLVEGGNVSGSTTTTLSLSNLASVDAGSYRCVVTNSAGSVTSSAAMLTIVVPPTVTSQPTSQTLNAGGAVVFGVNATGTAPLSYSWLKNGSPLSNGGNISGAATANLTVTSLTANDDGSYSVVVTNAAGSATSAAATLLVYGPPGITAQPSNATSTVGSSAMFTIAALGQGSLGYQWLKNGTPLANGGNVSGATTTTLNLATLTTGDAGSYQCVVTNAAGSATSLVATLTVIVPASIASQPASQTAYIGSTTIFSVGGTGTAPLTYSWSKNGSPLSNGGNISGANTANLTVSSASASDAGSYSAVVSNSGGSGTSSVAVLSIVPPPSISSQPVSVTVNTGSNAVFNVAAQSSTAVGYQWLKNGAPLLNGGKIAGATTSSLLITSATTSEAGSYQCVVTNGSGSATSLNATLTVIVPATISSQPASQTVNSGSAAVLSVGASGTAPISYSWSKNGIPLSNGGNISGANTANLMIGNAAASDAGSYTVVVSNGAGSATSSAAALFVITTPSISSQPVSMTVNTGSGAVFIVSAQSSASMNYQWLKNGAPVADGGNISGSATAVLNINNATSGDAGSYECVVTNSAGSVTSTAATLTIVVPPTLSTQPANQTANAGTAAVFNATATGTGPLAFAWNKNGSPLTDGGTISGANTGSLTIAGVAATDTGSYTVVVTNAAGSVTSSAAMLTVVIPPSITAQPSNVSVNAGTVASLSVMAEGSQILTYQWMHDGTPVANGARISGATSPSLTLLNTSATDDGSYFCVVTNAAGSATSAMATVTVIVAPSIATQPANQTSYVGATAMFTVAASGTAPFTYAWSKNGTTLVDGGNVSGATTASLNLTSISDSDAGSYSCKVSNSAGSATSIAATLSVSHTMAIISQPSSQTLNACDNLVLSVAVGGTATPAYQWMHNGSAIPDATNSTYGVNGVSGQDAGTYYVQVTGGGVLISSNAVVTVNDPVILAEPADNCVSVNGTNVFVVQACGDSLNYQWYFMASGSTNVTTLSGQTNTTLTIGPANSQNVGQYFCVISNSFNSISSRVASLGVEVPPTITTLPVNETVVAGASVTFSVGAKASAPLTFQWEKNNKTIVGATNSDYTIDSVQTSDSGTYQCYVGTTLCQSTALTSSAYGHLSITKAKPSSRFTSPTKNTLYSGTSAQYVSPTNSGTQITVSGIATDNGRVTDVALVRTFPAGAPMCIHPTLVGSPINYFWTNVVTLVPGTNIFDAIVTDAAGVKATNTVAVFLRVRSELHTATNGAGSILPLAPTTFGVPTNTALLDIGRNYRVQAKPAAGNMFSNWVDGNGVVLSRNAMLEFRMQTNLQLIANFATNPIMANGASGSYNGLFYETNEVRMKSAGAIFNLIVRVDASFSGLMKLDGQTYPLTGAFDVNGDAIKNVTRLGKTTVTVELHLDFVTKQITGTISSPDPDAWTSQLLADLAPYGATHKFQNTARYTLAVPPGDGAPLFSPGGFGYGFVTNTSLGVISFVGTLADGTTVSQTVPISQQGYWPLYIPLYGNRGLIEGWMNFANGSPSGNVSWIRPAGKLTTTYTNGFTNEVAIFGSPYVPRTPSLTPADGALDIGLPALTFQYAVSNNNAIVVLPGSPTNALAGSISAPTGAVSVSYRPTGTAVNQTARGAVLQWNNGAYGFSISGGISAPLHLH